MRISKGLREFIELLNAKRVEYVCRLVPIGRVSEFFRSPAKFPHEPGFKPTWRSLQAAGSRLFSTRPAEMRLGAAGKSACATKNELTARSTTQYLIPVHFIGRNWATPGPGRRGRSPQTILVIAYNSTVVSPHPAGVWTRTFRLLGRDSSRPVPPR